MRTEAILKKIEKDIKKKNDEFWNLPEAEQRVIIALDVIDQLRIGKLVAESGFWVTIKGRARIDEMNKQYNTLLGSQKCNACAIGGLFICAVKRANKLKANELPSLTSRADTASRPSITMDPGSDDLFNYLERFFSLEQLHLIEIAFEKGTGGINPEYGNIDHGIAIEFAQYIEEPEERMRLIMENIVVNGGTFKPGLKPKAVYMTPGFDEIQRKYL